MATYPLTDQFREIDGLKMAKRKSFLEALYALSREEIKPHHANGHAIT
jgi:hypothetical protein